MAQRGVSIPDLLLGGVSEDVEAAVSTKATDLLAEVKEIVSLPAYSHTAAHLQQDAESVVLPEEVMDELKEFVICIARGYRSNSFHNVSLSSCTAHLCGESKPLLTTNSRYFMCCSLSTRATY